MSQGTVITIFENESYYLKDTGCQFSPTCLACPLPVCKYDEDFLSRVKYPKKRQAYSKRMERFNAMLATGMPKIDAINLTAEAENVTTRTIWRTIEREEKIKAGD